MKFLMFLLGLFFVYGVLPFILPISVFFTIPIGAYLLVKGINSRCNEIDDDTAYGMAAHQLMKRNQDND